MYCDITDTYEMFQRVYANQMVAWSEYIVVVGGLHD